MDELIQTDESSRTAKTANGLGEGGARAERCGAGVGAKRLYKGWAVRAERRGAARVERGAAHKEVGSAQRGRGSARAESLGG